MDGTLASAISGTTTDANMPTLTTGSVLWARVTSDGTTLTVRCLAQSGEPSDGDWSGASDCYSSSNFDMHGGMIGFSCSNGFGNIDDVKIRSWNAGNSSFDIVEHADTFSIDGSDNITDTPTHDLAGNLTYDGSQKYTYDGWNRLKIVAHGYRDGAGTLQGGQSFDTMSYDGKGRRVKKAIANTGQWDCTYKYYSDGDSVVESRDGSDNPIKQYVWGTRYVDELVQNTVVTTSAGPTYKYDHYWACQDSNYNVLGVIDDAIGGDVRNTARVSVSASDSVGAALTGSLIRAYALRGAKRTLVAQQIADVDGVAIFQSLVPGEYVFVVDVRVERGSKLTSLAAGDRVNLRLRTSPTIFIWAVARSLGTPASIKRS